MSGRLRFCFFISRQEVIYPACDHSRREGNIRCWNYKDPIGSDQSGCVTRHHPQAKQELPWCGTTGTPDADCLIGQGQNIHLLSLYAISFLSNVRCLQPCGLLTMLIRLPKLVNNSTLLCFLPFYWSKKT